MYYVYKMSLISILSHCSNSSTPSQGLNRLGLGVQVLPPIPQSSSHTPMPASQPPKTSVATQNVPPSSTVNKPSPPTHPKISPPPPYSSPDQRPKTHTQSPRVVPRSYKLPDPQVKALIHVILSAPMPKSPGGLVIRASD